MRFPGWLAGLIIIALPAAALSQTVPSAILGDIQIKCGICHTDRIIPLGGEINFQEWKGERAGDEAVCYSCHNGVVKDSRGILWERFQHPSGIKPRGSSAIRRSGHPLDEEGRIFCGTCHTPHTRGSGVGFFMRFRNDGEEACRRCHQTRGVGVEYGEHPLARVEDKIPNRFMAAGGKAGKGQKVVCATCHRVHGARSPFLLVLEPWGRDGICQACHGINPSRDGEGYGNTGHPVNVKRPEAGSLEWSRGGIVLSPQGMVDCWSCHRAHNTAGGSPLLVREIEGGNGCATCHQGESSFSTGRGNHPVTSQAVGEAAETGERRVVCLDCHRAHNSFTKSKDLLSYDRTRPEICTGCHEARVGAAGDHPLEVAAEGDFLDKFESKGAAFGQGRTLICSTCHKTHGALRETPLLVSEERTLCLFCHPEQSALDAGRSRSGAHPILVPGDKVDPRVLEAGGKLGPEGEVICLTCHKVHGAGGGEKGLVMEKKDLICTLCHAEFDGMSSGSHNMALSAPGAVNRFGEDVFTSGLCRACHTEHGWAREVAEEGDEDQVSRLCLSCHNPQGEASGKIPAEVSHPLGVKPPAGLVNFLEIPLFLKDGRRFRRGMLSCATCHEIHGGEGDGSGSLLRLPLEGERSLCTVCHPGEAAVSGTKHDLSLTSPEEINIQGVRADEGGLCGPCHVAHGGIARSMWAKFVIGEGKAGFEFCRSCHFPGLTAGEKVPGEHSHPAGLPDESGPARGIPLQSDEDGITCLNCHDPHRWNPGDDSDRGGAGVEGDRTDSFLRWPDDDGSSLCLRCHPQQETVTGSLHDMAGGRGPEECFPGGGGESLCGGCHRTHDGKGPLGWPVELHGEGERGLRMCGTCHLDGGCAEGRQPGAYNHPIMVTPAGYTRDRLPLFTEDGRTSPGGVISCPTCHNVHYGGQVRENGGGEGKNPGRGTFLRLRSDGHSPLCAECHPEQSLVTGTDHDLRVTDPESRNRSGESPSASGVCGVCHGVHNDTYDFYLWNRGIGSGIDIITRLCTDCHDGEQRASRPERYYAHYRGSKQDLTSARTVFTLKRGSWVETKPNLPLYTGEGYPTSHGYVSCATCHQVHRWDTDSKMPGDGTPQEGHRGNSFLRLKGSFAVLNSFCVECHTYDAVQRYQEFHFPGGRDEQPAGDEK